MNEYDNDNDELDEYSSSNSFRARSNTWPLNRPDLTAPSSTVCIDETLPEIELEEDDLFTTTENWSAGFVDHDIMSWDPILNAQNQQQHQQQQQQQQQQHSQQATTATPNQPQIIHHQPEPHSQQQAAEHSQSAISQGHHRQQSIHLQQIPNHPQQQQQQQSHLSQIHCHPQQHHQIQQQPSSHHRSQQTHELFLDAGVDNRRVGNPNELLLSSQDASQMQQQQQQQQQPSPNSNHCGQALSQQRQQRQTRNNSSCLNYDDSSEYHIQQLDQLRLDGPNDPQQEHYPTTSPDVSIAGTAQTSQLSSLCMTSDGNDPSGNEYCIMTASSEHHHHHHHHTHHHPHESSSHLQQLTSARYDYDLNEHQQPQPPSHHQQHHIHHPQLNGYDVKLRQDDNLNNHHHQHQYDHTETNSHLQHASNHLHNHQYSSHHLQHETIHSSHHPHHHHHQPQHQQQYHDLTSSGFDNEKSGSNILSSSLSTSGIGLSADLEDLDYKQVNPQAISPSYDETLLQQQQQSNSSEKIKSETQSSSSAGGSSNKQTTDSNSSTSKSKLNAPRRNAWGNLSYADLISQAIESTSDKRLTLAQIYDWMVQHVPYFKDKGDSNSSAGWKNSVRHNLSLHSRFRRLQNEGTGKSSWWTINPEANIGKCARRRAASMEASKYEKKRGRAKKRAEAIRQGLISYPSLTNSSLNGSTNTLGDQHSQAQSLNQFHAPGSAVLSTSNSTKSGQSESQAHQDQTIQPLDHQFTEQQSQQQQSTQMLQLQIQTLEDYDIEQPPSQQQQQHLRQLQQADQQQRQSQMQHQPQQVSTSRYEDKEDNTGTLQQQRQQTQQQSQYYYQQQFELSTAL